MDIPVRIAAALALVALVPFGIYAGMSGELTAVTAAIGALNVVLIAGMLVVLFGPSPSETANGATH